MVGMSWADTGFFRAVCVPLRHIVNGHAGGEESKGFPGAAEGGYYNKTRPSVGGGLSVKKRDRGERSSERE